MNEFNPWHLLILAAVFLLLFGANKLPQMARSVGQSMRIFKAETRALTGEKEAATLPPTASPAATGSAAPPAAATQPSRVQSFPTEPHHGGASPAHLQEKPPTG